MEAATLFGAAQGGAQELGRRVGLGQNLLLDGARLAEQVALELAEELDRRGHHNDVVALSLGHEHDAVDELTVLVPSTSHRPPTLVRGAWQLRRRLRAHPVDVVLAHGAAAAMVAVVASPRRGPAIVWQTIVGMADQSFGPVQARCWAWRCGRAAACHRRQPKPPMPPQVTEPIE